MTAQFDGKTLTCALGEVFQLNSSYAFQQTKLGKE